VGGHHSGAQLRGSWPRFCTGRDALPIVTQPKLPWCWVSFSSGTSCRVEHRSGKGKSDLIVPCRCRARLASSTLIAAPPAKPEATATFRFPCVCAAAISTPFVLFCCWSYTLFLPQSSQCAGVWLTHMFYGCILLVGRVHLHRRILQIIAAETPVKRPHSAARSAISVSAVALSDQGVLCK
jgi:hypothetical protein